MPLIIYNKDVIEILVLFLLQQEDMYAYQIMKQIQALSGERISVMGGSLYPILYKFTEKGYVTDRVEAIGKRQRMNRIYYHITPQGEKYMDSLLEENNLIQQAIQSVFKNGKKKGKAS